MSALKANRVIAGAYRRSKRLLDSTREHHYRRSLGVPFHRGEAGLSISIHGDAATSPVCGLVRQSFDNALAGVGGPPDFVRAIDGMSGQKYRTFISNLVRSLKDARYLEVGSWKGSTAAAALFGNSVKALCVDNWSEFGGPREEFFANIEAVKSDRIDFRFIERDFRLVDYSAIGRFNVFFFDGPHREADQYDGIMIARPALDGSFVLIVDDWNWASVRLGTFRALRDSGYSIHTAIEVRTTQDNGSPTNVGKSSDWHNGYFMAVLSAAR